jgi:hypothetical protein
MDKQYAKGLKHGLVAGMVVTLLALVMALFAGQAARADSFTFSYSDGQSMFHVYRPYGAYPPYYNRGPRVNITINGGGGMYSKYYRGGGERFLRPFKPHYERRKTHTPQQYWGPPKGGWTVTVR